MRPLHLKFKGLRSYQRDQEIDFTNINLAAIIGNTGAGKSSILEAMCFALYGYPTWAKQNSSWLAAHGGDGAVRAELTFRAGDKTWCVRRATTIDNYKRTDALTCRDTGTTITGFNEVTAEITRIIGFDHDGFLKAIVLPQGRFQELLHAKTKQRADILETALGLDKITDMRECARAKRDQLLPARDKLRNRLRDFRDDDPEKVITETTQRLAELTAEQTTLSAEANTCSQASAELSRATHCADELRTAADRLHQRTRNLKPAETEDRYRTLTELNAHLKQRLTETDHELTAATDEDERLQAQLDAAEHAGTGVSGTAAAANTLQSLQKDLPEIQDELARLAERNTLIQRDREQLEQRKNELPTLTEAITRRESDVATTASALSVAQNTLELHRSMLRTARQAHEKSAEATAAVQTAETAVGSTTEALVAAQRVSDDADKHVEDTETLLEETRRHNSAAHAAEHHGPGDPCPLCVRPLPADFQPPTRTDLGEATTAWKKATQDAKRAGAELSHARAARNQAELTWKSATTAAEQAASEAATALDSLAAALGDGDLARTDDSLLADTIAAVQHADTMNKQAQAGLQEAQNTHRDHSAELRRDEKDLARRQKDTSTALESCTNRRNRAIHDYRCIPTEFRDNDAPDPDAIARALEHIEQRRHELTAVSDKAATIRKRVKDLTKEQAALREQKYADVERPVQQLAEDLRVLAENATAVPLGIPVEIPTRPQPCSISTDAAWSRALLEATQRIIETCRREVDGYDQASHRARGTITSVLTEFGMTTPEALRTRIGAVQELIDQSESRLAQARIDKPLREEVVRRLALVEPELDALRELGSLLSAGTFIGFVLKRRQQDLLGIATSVLMDMTRGRLAFLPDFMIMDRQTCQPRDVKTLSGGETFMASLALALALVQLTSRGGANIDALFLDEGFGSLDSNTLSEAMDTLTRQAATGRLVAVITHMRNVAENFDNILMVTKDRNGNSEAHWATPEERDRMITDDLGGGLLE
ncbi:SMC family ATPase [Nocardia vinacea]|uniref:SMC family ATPase n=1 Tax=Nocardia vinacea TaxID=96468 RepID=UPI002E1127BD|nr:SMC family ATPase [Nocardia vinacea]